MNAREAAKYLGISLRSFYDLGLPCYKYGPRMSRWEKAELDEFKLKCRSTPRKAAGAGHLTVSLAASGSDLRNSFRKAGVALKPKPTTERKVLAFTQNSPASKSQDSHSQEP